MYQITREEVMLLLQKMRQIRHASGEMIAFLEHMMQLQDKDINVLSYNPDEYLERIARNSGYSETSSEKTDHPSGKEL